MITQNEDKSIDVDYDIFSFAGRASLVAGGIYAINQSVKEGKFNATNGNTFKRRENAQVQALKETINRASQPVPSATSDAVNYKTSPFFQKIKAAKNNGMSYPKSLEDIRDKFSGGFKGQSAELFNSLQSLQERVTQADGKMPTLGVRYGADGSLEYVSFKTKAGNLRIHPVSNEGFVTTGSDAQNKYIARSFYSHNGYDIGSIYGSDVGMADFFTENYDRLKDGELTLKEVNHSYQQSLLYSDKQFGETLATNRLNPEILDMIRESAIEDPTLKLNKGVAGRKQAMGRTTKKKFMQRQAQLGKAQGSASDIAKGIINTVESPIHQLPFLAETNNPKQLIRNVQYQNSKGFAEYTSLQDTLFMGDADLELLREELKARGKTLGELAPEQLLINKNKAGKIIDKTRSLQINASKITDSSEYLLNAMASNAGISIDEFSERIAANGFDAFDSTIQEKLRKVSLDDYPAHIKRELDKSIERRNTIVKSNLSVQNADELAKLDGEVIPGLKTKLKESRFFGSSVDDLQAVKLGKEHRGLFVDNLHYTKGKLTVQLRREKILGAGDKIHDPSGELKAIVKGEVDDLPGLLANVYKKKHGVSEVPADIMERFENTTFVASNKAMKTTIQGRNAYSALIGIANEAGLSSNQSVQTILNEFYTNYPNMSDAEKTGVFAKLNEIAKENGTSLHGLSGKETGLGFATKKMVAFGNAAVDMGYGGEAFFSERHVKLFHALGLKNFTNEIIAGRNNKGVVRAYKDFNTSMQMIKDTKFQGHFNLDDMSSNFFENIFPSLDGDSTDVLAHRNKFLSDRGINGTAYVNLGEEIEGINKIAIFNTQDLMGHIGPKIGSAGEYKKYTELEQLTRNILTEASRKNRSPEKLKNLVNNYKAATDQLDKGLKDNLFKGKAEKGLYGLVTSGREGMEGYARKLAKSMGTKNALPFVAAVSDKKFIEMFGQDAYEQFRKTGLSRSWAMATREPVEGLSSVPLNVVPSGGFKDINRLSDNAISVITKEDKGGYSLLKSLFGDTDGDAFSLVAATSDEAAKELSALAYGNSENSLAFREAQRVKSKLSLKGQTQKSILETTIAEMREATFYAKDLEKGLVGSISNSLKPLHEVNMLKHGAGVDPEKFTRVENFLHTFAENVIKGKHQTIDQLRSGNAMRTLSAITATEDFAKASVSDRIKNLRDFHDQLFLSEGAHLGKRIRAGEKSADLIAEMKKFNLDTDSILNDGWFTSMTSDQSMKDLLEVSDISKRSSSMIDDAIELSREEVDDVLSASKKYNKKVLEGMKESAEEAKKIMHGVGGNIMKYAVLPAAAFGFLGTVMGSKSRISQEGEYSDGQQGHEKTSSGYRLTTQPQMDTPKYMKPEITGTGKGGFQIDKYTSSRGGANVRVTDHSRSFDRLDMMDTIEKGY